MTAPFHPTHSVPAGGLSVWSVPDGNRPASHHLDAGLAVRVVAVQGQWAQVVCDNGFSGWVDGTRLVAPSAAPARGRSPWLAISIGAVVLVVVAAGLLVAGGGDDDDDVTTDRTPATRSDDVEVALNVPAGWSVSDDGLVAAEDAADLDADDPDGPVVRATFGEADDVDFAAVAVDAFDAEEAGEGIEFAEPEEQSVDGFDAVAISVRTGGRVQVSVAVHPPGGEPVVFLLDSPADRFDELRSLLASVPGLSEG